MLPRQQQRKQLHLSELPSTVVEYGILEFLDPKSLIQMSLTNRQFHQEVHHASSPWASLVASHFGISTQLFEQTHGNCDWRKIYISLMWTNVLVLRNLQQPDQFLAFYKTQTPSPSSWLQPAFEPQWDQVTVVEHAAMHQREQQQQAMLQSINQQLHFEVNWSLSSTSESSGCKAHEAALSLRESEILNEILLIEALRKFPHSLEILSLYATLLRGQQQAPKGRTAETQVATLSSELIE